MGWSLYLQQQKDPFRESPNAVKMGSPDQVQRYVHKRNSPFPDLITVGS